MEHKDLQRDLVAVMFVAAEPLSLKRLAVAVGVEAVDVKPALTQLRQTMAKQGINLIESSGKYQLVSHPDSSAAVERFLGAQNRAELSKPALETLAVVAYRQPVTKTEIDQIRGVESSQTLRALQMRGLINEAGTANSPGKPIVYATSAKLLQALGLSHADELPPLPDLATEES